ncbi:MAG TPA: thiamine pyrophosphate-dependent enzyme [Candidatus Ratteibacteria bacterium]|nr:thiamine pyrophosphate-dependent enzyme [bacterium]HRS06232.1 thiamine pyrophosphate-dependent enzyme [Candidatus Ratteibacteria bacterium]HRV03958.1 thiamine pyrophosphate-dependent enzyme [Candidatus Ratteibacteria bacterium]
MDITKLNTNAKNTWCTGCGNFAILNALKLVVKEIVSKGTPIENIVLVSGIGCHAKIVDYINLNSFYSLHGRVVPVAQGIKIANPSLKVIGFSGDGDSYGEGLEHLLFAAKRNIDITMIIHNNRVYGLTTGQFTPTSPVGYKGRSTPYGNKEKPFNPIELMIAAGATFVARTFSHGIDLLKRIMLEAIMHKGFSIVDVLQVCVTFFNMYEYYDKRVYIMEENNLDDFDIAMKKAREWDYNSDTKIPLGIFYKKEEPTFEESFISYESKKFVDRELKVKEILKKYSI